MFRIVEAGTTLLEQLLITKSITYIKEPAGTTPTVKISCTGKQVRMAQQPFMKHTQEWIQRAIQVVAASQKILLTMGVCVLASASVVQKRVLLGGLIGTYL
jgi:hypothetical protein